ncbi:MAG: beta-ketoacyl synthase N-terminal-like domain-containing protein, partial [Pseudomonadota bacterium]
MTKRAVITGMGMVSPLAGTLEPSWRRLLAGEAAGGPIDKFDASEMPCRIAASVPKSSGAGGGQRLIDEDAADETFNPDDWMSPKDQRRNDEFIVFGVAAAEMAFKHAGLELQN